MKVDRAADHIPDEINYTDSNDRLEINNHLLFYTIKIDDSTSFTRISFTTFIIFGVIVMFAGVEYIKLKTKES
jgi:hypothetical protein